MHRYLLTIEYDGTPFEGWQTQDGKRTIEGEIESAIYNVCHENVRVNGSGRTDSGVHAIAQTAHFDIDRELDVSRLARAINHYLPVEIAIKHAIEVDEDFHARYSVKKKSYLYKIYNAKNRSPLRENRYMFTSFDLDIDRMNRAIADIVGEHDFSGLMTLGSSVKTTIRTIYDAHIDVSGDEIYVYITGSGFLYNMVRTIVGTLVDIGRGNKGENAFRHILLGDGMESKGAVAPACGLYLYSVEY